MVAVLVASIIAGNSGDDSEGIYSYGLSNGRRNNGGKSSVAQSSTTAAKTLVGEGDSDGDDDGYYS